MRTTTVLLTAGVALGLAATAAPADADRVTAPVRPFVLPDLTGLTAIFAETQLTFWDVVFDLPAPLPDAEVDFTSVTFDLGADLSIAPHWVILARLPLFHSSAEDVEGRVGEEGSGLGNVTVGVRGLGSKLLGEELRGVLGGELSVSLPTAPDEGENGLAAVLAASARASHDPGRYLPNTTTLRLGAHGQLYGRWFLVQGEAGLHLFVFDDDAGDDDSDVAVKLGLAAGVRLTHALAVLAELNGFIDLGDDDVSSIDLGLRYGAESLFASARLFLPLDDVARDLDMIGVGFDLGLRL